MVKFLSFENPASVNCKKNTMILSRAGITNDRFCHKIVKNQFYLGPNPGWATLFSRAFAVQKVNISYRPLRVIWMLSELMFLPLLIPLHLHVTASTVN